MSIRKIQMAFANSSGSRSKAQGFCPHHVEWIFADGQLAIDSKVLKNGSLAAPHIGACAWPKRNRCAKTGIKELVALKSLQTLDLTGTSVKIDRKSPQA